MKRSRFQATHGHGRKSGGVLPVVNVPSTLFAGTAALFVNCEPPPEYLFDGCTTPP